LLKDAKHVFEVCGFEAKVVLVGGGGEGNVDVGVCVEGFEEVAYAGEGLGGGKVLLLQ
jgi:hypothetical protein